jgi:predicted SnoaL-like aldol condensation-catalyzing enzyme
VLPEIIIKDRIRIFGGITMELFSKYYRKFKEDKKMNNKEKAIALISSFATGDVTVSQEILKEDYIQHNLLYGTGRDAFAGSIAYLGSAPIKTTVKNIRVFEDGDKVFLHTIYNFAGAGEQVAFDIFRFEDGIIAEHWDNIAAITPPNPSGHTQTDGPVQSKEVEKNSSNKAIVKNFIEDVLMGKNPQKTPEYFDGDNYIQHNSGIADGLSGLGAALEELAKSGIQMIYNETHQIIGEGDMVLAVSEGTFGGTPTSYYDLFRVENGKISEHWDVMETILQEDKRANANGKF